MAGGRAPVDNIQRLAPGTFKAVDRMRFSRFLALYLRHFRDHRRERMFLASLSFFVTFGVARAVIHAFRAHRDPFELWIGGIHVHHLVWGIFLLLIVGYVWLIQVGTRSDGSVRMGRITAVLYGVGAALTLDEYALWLNLRDVYWEREGRASVDIAILFGALVSAGLWGGPFLRGVVRQLVRWSRVGSGRRPLAPPSAPQEQSAPVAPRPKASVAKP